MLGNLLVIEGKMGHVGCEGGTSEPKEQREDLQGRQNTRW